MIEINTNGLPFYSQLDEDHFFTWAQEIPCVASIAGGILQVVTENIAEPDLRDLLAVLYRYSVPMAELAALVSPSNEAWFADPNTYWHNKVVGSA